jgi:hypothetical protein
MRCVACCEPATIEIFNDLPMSLSYIRHLGKNPCVFNRITTKGIFHKEGYLYMIQAERIDDLFESLIPLYTGRDLLL